MPDETSVSTTAPPVSSQSHAAHLWRWLDDNPGIKLLVAAWAVAGAAMSFWSFYDEHVWKRREAAVRAAQEALREGRLYGPAVQLFYDASGCYLTNRDTRPVLFPQLCEYVYRTKLTDCPTSSLLSVNTLTETAPSLAPRATLSAPMGLGAQAAVRNVKANPGGCERDGHCLLVLECRATYYRAADHEYYRRSDFLVVDPAAVGEPWRLAAFVGPISAGSRYRHTWTNQRYRSALACVLQVGPWRAQMGSFVPDRFELDLASLVQDADAAKGHVVTSP